MSIFKSIREKVAATRENNGTFTPNVGLSRLVPVMLCPTINEYNLYMYNKIENNEVLKQKIAEKKLTLKLLMKNGSPVGVDVATLTPSDMMSLGFKNSENEIDKNMFTYTGTIDKEVNGKTITVKKLDLVLYFEAKGSNRPVRHSIRIINEINRNKAGDKTQFINDGMKTTWGVDVSTLPSWFTTITNSKTNETKERKIKPLYVGEEKLYSYLAAVNAPNNPFGVSSYDQIDFFDLDCFFEEVKSSNKEEVTARKVATMESLRDSSVNIVIKTKMPDGNGITKEIGVLALLGAKGKLSVATNTMNYNQGVLSVNNAATFVSEMFTAQSMMHYDKLSDAEQVKKFVAIYETDIKRKQQGDASVRLTPLHYILDKLFGFSDNTPSILLSNLNQVKDNPADAIVYTRYIPIGVVTQTPATVETVVEDQTDDLPF